MIVSRKVALAVGGVAAAAVVGTAGVAAAAGTSGGAAQRVELAAVASPAPSASPSAGERERKHPRAARLGRGLHGEFVAKGKDGKLVTVVTVRGTVTAVGPASVTIKAEDGYTATMAVGGETKVRGKEVDAIADVKVGDRAAAAGVKTSGGITARTVLVREK